MGGTLEESRDIFQDALVIYYEKSLQPHFSPALAAEPYILGIAKHLWIRKFRKQAQMVSLTELENTISIPEDYFPAVDDQRLLSFLERSGRKCLNLLKAFYYESLPMKEIATVFGFSTDRSATVQKYKCLEKVRDTIKEKSLGYEDFLK
ncbi:sigma-70 family RNA polymerase sigma factor [Flammeovirgaceae bacterium 311]|nr:sigma-70 family RNA polymerase sigma factor [Flammeovirgaceae bacterium 311]